MFVLRTGSGEADEAVAVHHDLRPTGGVDFTGGEEDEMAEVAQFRGTDVEADDFGGAFLDATRAPAVDLEIAVLWYFTGKFNGLHLGPEIRILDIEQGNICLKINGAEPGFVAFAFSALANAEGGVRSEPVGGGQDLVGADDEAVFIAGLVMAEPGLLVAVGFFGELNFNERVFRLKGFIAFPGEGGELRADADEKEEAAYECILSHGSGWWRGFGRLP